MPASDIMTSDLASCRRDTSLQQAAQLMLQHDCGAIPVIDQSGSPVGIITDRDIVCRAVAEGKNPLELTVQDCMTSPVDTVGPDTSLEDCCDIMERDRIRRLVVVDSATGRCCGIIAQADIARSMDERHTADVVKEISQPG